MVEYIIKGGKVFCYKNRFEGEELDILVRDGKIADIGEDISGKNIIDARGYYVLQAL